jgi:hypothetical protein
MHNRLQDQSDKANSISVATAKDQVFQTSLRHLGSI